MLTSKPWRLYFKQALWFISSFLVNCSINHAASCACCIIWNLQMRPSPPPPRACDALVYVRRDNKKDLSHCMTSDLICIYSVEEFFSVQRFFEHLTFCSYKTVWAAGYYCSAYFWRMHIQISVRINDKNATNSCLFVTDPRDPVALNCPFSALEVSVIKSYPAVCVCSVYWLVLHTQCQVPWLHL